MPKCDCSVVLISWAPREYRMHLLRRTIKTLRENTKRPYTLVVVDNGAEHQTDYLRTVKPDIHIINAVNQGPGGSRNIGAGATNSDYIAFIDNDLIFYPGWLQDSVDALEKFPMERYIVAPTRSAPMKNPKNLRETLDGGYELWSMVAGYCVVMRRSSYEEIGPWNKDNPIEDREYANCAVRKGYFYLWYPGGQVLHKGRRKSFDKKKQLVNGVWVKKEK